MDITGTAHGDKIVLDQPRSLPEGTRVRVEVSAIADPERGSPIALLSIAGTLTDAEAEAISKAAAECRRIDPSLWNGAA